MGFKWNLNGEQRANRKLTTSSGESSEGKKFLSTSSVSGITRTTIYVTLEAPCVTSAA